MTVTESPARPRRGPGQLLRSERPERIRLGHIEYVRNDVVARELCICERTLHRGDARGAPYRKFGGIKYRPFPEFADWIASGIQRGKPPSRRRNRR
jgi:hypothetical protein